jgi:hypothetical protein
MTAFYIVGLKRCPCGKPVEVMVQASGNVDYGSYCKKCGALKVKQLQRVYDEREQQPAAGY